MRIRSVRAVAAAGLAVVVGVAGVAQPSQAAEPDGSASTQVHFAFDWVGAVISVASTVFGGGDDADLDAAIAEVVSAVEASKTDIINHIDAIANAEVQACVRSHTIELADIDAFPLVVVQLWAQEATQCATLATEYFNAVQSMPAADNLGFLIGEIHAIAIAARAKAGFSIVGLMENYIDASEAVITKMMPECELWHDGGSPPFAIVTWFYECVAYNGDSAIDSHTVLGSTGDILPEPIDEEAVENEAARNTSRPVAQDALPKLEAALP